MSEFPRIIVIAVYFGRLPDYFPLWLTSCGFNPDVDWLVITDAPTEIYRLPPNVHVHAMTMSAFAERLSGFAEIPVALNDPYKVCDFRPLFGYFADFVPGSWDFWGHCDLDMLFGNIRQFLSSEILSNNDKIFGVGHFTLYKNDDNTNNFYKKYHPNLDYRAIFSNKEHFGFDEHIGVNRIWKFHNGRIHEDESIILDVDPNVERMVRTNCYNDVRNDREQIFCFDRGRVKRLYWGNGMVQDQEFMYIHFQKRRFNLPVPGAEADRVYVTPRGFVPMDEAGEPSRALMSQLNPRPNFPSLKEISHRLRQRIRLARNRMKWNRTP